MIISNEPGYYKEGYFGIRIENLIFIKKNKFEELTMAPMEKDLIKKFHFSWWGVMKNN